MANDLVVNLGARLDQFNADMNQAGAIAEGTVAKIEQQFASLNPGINLSAMAGIAGGALAGLGALFAALHNINSELAELSKNAEYAGVSVRRFQELQFAATQGGVSSDEATSSLRNVARLLADAKENENSLTKLLEHNNLSYKDRNGDVIKLNQLLTIAGDLIKRFDSMPEKVEAAKMLGLSEAWVQALHNGGKAFNDLAASAESAGAVIDKSTIAKAEAFDTAWKKSSALLASQMKAAAGDAAGFLDDLIQKTSEFFTELAKARGATPGEGQEKFNAYADAVAVAEKETRGLAQDVDQLTRVIDRMVAKGGDPEIIAGLEAARAKAEELNKELAKTNLGIAMTQFPGGVPSPAARPAGADRPSPGAATLPTRGGGGEGRDKFETEIQQIERRTATLKADTATTFENAAAQAQLRAEFRLLEAIKVDEGEVTQEQLNRYEQLRTSMTATQALQASGIVLTKEHAEAFKSASVAIGQATAAHTSAVTSLQRLNSASQQIGSALSTAFADAIVEGKSLNDVFKSLITTLEKAAINSLVMSFFTPGVGGGTSLFGSLFTGGGTGIGGIGHAAGGTNFASGGLTMVGESGPELVNLPRGSQVIPNDVTRSISGGSSIIYSPAIDARGASVEAVARLAQIMEQDRASFASRTVQTIQQARRGRVPGL